MKINKTYDFFFHPFSPSLPPQIQYGSIITICVLSILSCGLYLALFTIINLRDRSITKETKPSKCKMVFQRTYNNKVDHLIKQNRAQVEEFSNWAKENRWDLFRPSLSHYDWWAFPVQRPSQSYGEKYAFSDEELRALRLNKAFMAQYRKGVQLVLLSWGWDAKKGKAVKNPHKYQHWTHYGVRLGKMADSLYLLHEKKLFKQVQQFVQEKVDLSKLQDWVAEKVKKKFP